VAFNTLNENVAFGAEDAPRLEDEAGTELFLATRFQEEAQMGEDETASAVDGFGMVIQSEAEQS
jgi:hypothetical protein